MSAAEHQGLTSKNKMKLLLTSGGLTNKSIASALFDLVGKKPEDTSLVFIPTASNVETEDKGWLINDFANVKNQNFKSVFITDIAAVSESIWKPQMEAADILLFGGGNTYYLMEWINKSGLAKILPEFLKAKVYVGISAGSMVTNPDLDIRLDKMIYEDDVEGESMTGLNFVDFYFLPHLNSPHFSNRMEKNIRKAAEKYTQKMYALDDQSALKVVDGKVDVISEGKWFAIN